ncbi:MAG: GTPase, partial [bacterium]|nr:GTPase [bacterium]
GTKAILNYYASLSHSKISLWTSKMIIVGEGETGKSCLLDSLENLPFEKGKPTTHGIDIRTLKIPHPKKKDVTMELNTWDFGGQEIYHATHQFYLTDNSIFLLVWNARQGFESGKIYKWLETIKALAPGSPILIVATRAEKRGADLPRDELSALYPKNITGFFEIDNATGYGIPELAKVIQKQAAKLKYMGIERPAAWVEAAKEIRKQESKYMGKEELIALFRQGEVDKKNDESLLLYLHEQGEILYYPNEEELQNTIIIKPEWVSKHIAYILDSPELTKQAGFLKKALMQKIWHDLSPDLQEKFLVLMEKFDLSYRTKDNRERSLVVEKLKYEEDLRYKKLWEEKAEAREITLKYELSTIPAGIPTWFIARTHRFTKYIHWKHGALLEDEEKKHLGLIVANPNQKSVRLIVRGLMPYYFLSLLRDTFELTLSRFKGLELTRKIPCPGHNGKECPHEFELEDLERRLEKKPPRLTIECPKAMEDVDVSKLLFGISSATHEDLVEKIRKSVSKDIKKELKKEHKKQNEELIKLVQIEFLNSYKHQQEIMDITCPNVFTLKPKHKNWLTRSVESHDFELRLFCQKPGHWHPVKEGKYDIKIPKQWLITIAPYYNKIIKYLKWIAPAFLPLSGSLLSEADYADYKDEITAGGKWANKLDSVDTNGDDLDSAAYMHQASGAELRQVRELLKKADPQKVWGGLERVSTPEGHILWLCPEHKEEYK